ncbi:TPA: hypothetical protein RZC39_001381 [Salmonella enterica subsp. enterica serovar Liverpool]|uniref:Uncharacterized protein n=9 Tax=Salmonella enterica TaxID=28901 RepID=A0A5I9U1A0_SALPT|nr:MULTISPECIES: hypothetical protein [Salmonella]EAA0559817.1 hypothetical protein [Salmonella enterica subsp. enterica serovar Lexington]EAB6693845.1 hypothetical protein [Salmonella enterica subsp. enterica serovar Kapemba]EAB7346751.1 hypothetical protein [Salmonella enterica subsp. enterica serovar Epalinges]EBA0151322.1 hypothetical protein [Salmonella enterica subsp. enterica serovar Enteritidis]EBI0290614.1 hypothetical protein [Salmonella enterica subsp. enterica serovar Saintpaul]EB
MWQKSALTTVPISLSEQAVYSGMRYEVNISAAKCDGTGVTFGTINNCTITLSLPAGASIITRHFSADL